MNRTTIRLKLLLTSSLLLFAIFSGMTVYLTHNSTQTLRQNLQSETKSFAVLANAPIAEAYDTYSDSGTAMIRQKMLDYLALNKNVTNIAIIGLDAKPLFIYDEASPIKISTTQATSFDPIYISKDGALQQVIYPYFEASGAHPYNIVYVVSDKEITAAVQRETTSLVLFGLSSLLLTSALTYVLINRIIVKPVRELSRQAKIISDGNLEQQIEIHGNDEIAALGNAVNTMADSLKGSIAKLQEVDKVKSEFMAITSHNLRTPLTIINGYLENLEIFKTPDQMKDAMSRIGESVKRLDGFAEDVLTISQYELGDHIASQTTFTVADMLQQIADETRAAADLKGVHFESDINTTATITASKPHIRSAIWNIIDNAIKFTPKDGGVKLKVDDADNKLRIAVTDSGIGISEAEIPKLFTKFHRATSVITYDYEGTGIGLYASKLIVEQYNGNITVDSKEGSGSTFTISLPIAAPIPTTSEKVE